MKATDVTIRKWNGDDAYSWAVIDKRNGHPVHPSLTGLSRSQARFYRDRTREQITGVAPPRLVR